MAPLNDWAAQSLARHLDTVASADVPLVYAGAGRSEAAMQAAASATLSKILIAAGLRSNPAVKPASVRAWAGRRVFVETGRIEEAALALGCRHSTPPPPSSASNGGTSREGRPVQPPVG